MTKPTRAIARRTPQPSEGRRLRVARAACLIGLCISGWCATPELRAGCVVTKTMNGLIGTVAVEGSNVTVRTDDSSVTLGRDQVLWLNTDPGIDSLLVAAQRAGSAGLSTDVVKKLLAASMREEPRTAAEARNLYVAITRAETAAVKPTAATSAPQHIVNYDFSFEQSDLAGWQNWGSSQTPGAIRTPLFHSTHVQTSGSIAAK